MDMRWTNANMTSFRSPRTSAEVKLLTSPCPDGGQNYSFLGSNYQLLDTWLFLIWSSRASADDVKLCPTPCPIWLITIRGLLYTSEVKMISIQHSDCSSFCPTFSFRIEGAHFAAVSPSCPDEGQNYSFFGSNYQLLGPWLFLIWSPRASADDVKLCPTPCPIWLIASRGLLYTSEVEMISIHQSYCSSFCPTFSFRIEDMPILLQFSHHAVCCMACCEVQMTIHTGSVGGGYGLPLIPRKQNTWQ